MKNKSTSAPSNSLNKQHEDTHFKDQLNLVFEGFFEKPQSMKMLSVKLKIDRANICWFCREFRKSNKLGIARKGICAITKRVVNYYTTNPDFIPASIQIVLDLQ